MTNYPKGIRFRLAWWAILVNFASLLYLVPGILAIAFAVWALSLGLHDEGLKPFTIFLLIIITLPLFILSLVLLCYFLIVIGQVLFSYLELSPLGIEYRKWPNYGLRCNWSDVEKKGVYQSLGIFPYDVLYLKKAEPVGWQLTMSIRRKLGLRQQCTITLTGIHGWPNGQLAKQLKKYIPEILSDQLPESKKE